VNFRFYAEEWGRLARAERIGCCTAFAEEAQKLAVTADEKLRPLYMDLTVQWLMLASALSKMDT
jgi:hypothetical protein